MERIKIVKEKRYTINRLRNGFCYRTTLDCPWSAVLDAKREAKMLGETIEYEYERTIEHKYVLCSIVNRKKR